MSRQAADDLWDRFWGEGVYLKVFQTKGVDKEKNVRAACGSTYEEARGSLDYCLNDTLGLMPGSILRHDLPVQYYREPAWQRLHMGLFFKSIPAKSKRCAGPVDLNAHTCRCCNIDKRPRCPRSSAVHGWVDQRFEQSNLSAITDPTVRHRGGRVHDAEFLCVSNYWRVALEIESEIYRRLPSANARLTRCWNQFNVVDTSVASIAAIFYASASGARASAEQAALAREMASHIWQKYGASVPVVRLRVPEDACNPELVVERARAGRAESSRSTVFEEDAYADAPRRRTAGEAADPPTTT